VELHLDLTSDNNIFNCLTPQGNWYFHKFGKRNFPISEISYPILLKYLKVTSVDKILCDSFYGDSFLYKNVLDLAKYCDTNNIELTVTTHGSKLQNDVLSKLQDTNTTIYLKLFGCFDTANLITKELDWDYIQTLLELFKNKIIVEYNTFNENTKNINKLIELCYKNNNGIIFKRGNIFGDWKSSIIDSKGEWLYDFSDPFFKENIYDIFLNGDKLLSYKDNFILNTTDLNRTTYGYNKLLSYLTNKKYKNILDYNMEHPFKIEVEKEDTTYINYMGYTFTNRQIYETFNHCLSNDWSKDLPNYVNLHNENLDVNLFQGDMNTYGHKNYNLGFFNEVPNILYILNTDIKQLS
tara:strand:- start:803 stop:1858 length:1056 start_codon:yes stop_codon:yes gene_type:complete